MTAPVYLGALQAFSAYEPRFDILHPEDGSRTPESYAAAAASGGEGARVKLAYAVPDFDNPTGATLSPPARENLLALARDLDIPLIEDCAYRALRFEGESPPTLQAMDVARSGSLDQSRVIHLGTFSKTIAPGLRLGWVCASRAIVRRLVLIKQASDLNAPLINQMAMTRLAAGEFDRLVASARAHYCAKRDAMLAALERDLPELAVNRPDGGYFLWGELDGVDAGELLVGAEQAGVTFVKGTDFGSAPSTFRLAFSFVSLDEIDEGVARLAAALPVASRG
jgi:DNA-binding transcriptional MocR family regulator